MGNMMLVKARFTRSFLAQLIGLRIHHKVLMCQSYFVELFCMHAFQTHSCYRSNGTCIVQGIQQIVISHCMPKNSKLEDERNLWGEPEQAPHILCHMSHCKSLAALCHVLIQKMIHKQLNGWIVYFLDGDNKDGDHSWIYSHAFNGQRDMGYCRQQDFTCQSMYCYVPYSVSVLKSFVTWTNLFSSHGNGGQHMSRKTARVLSSVHAICTSCRAHGVLDLCAACIQAIRDVLASLTQSSCFFAYACSYLWPQVVLCSVTFR